MVQEKAKSSTIGFTTRGTSSLGRRPFSGAAPLGVRPRIPTCAQAGTESVLAGASFTQKVPLGRNSSQSYDFNVNDISEQCLENSAKTSLVSSTSFEWEDARAPPPPVSTRKSAWDVTTIKSQSVGMRRAEFLSMS